MKDPKVDEHISKLNPEEQEIINRLRNLVLNSDSEIREHIKWNSPAFYYGGEMKAFDAKEYKRDLLVLNSHRGKILLVFPTGAKITDAAGLKGKNYPDGRKIITLETVPDLEKIETQLQAGITDWLNQIEK
ncbi:DUF1801 domain-containing protein [Fluviicola sp.]|uniref:DUF1801 domain-containing protein n=1 Tax=Fluviicola sp. TaxID=1917219 RepID=UPI00263172D2|nr:DUF1801 domain-containing protein [Fluviicola sp.]